MNFREEMERQAAPYRQRAVMGEARGILQGQGSNNGYCDIRPVNDSIETLVNGALAFHGDKPTTEQKALDAVATVTLRELGNRTHTIAAQNDHIRQLDGQLVALYKDNNELTDNRNHWRSLQSQTMRRAELAECHLDRIMGFLLKPDADRVPYADVPLAVAATILGLIVGAPAQNDDMKGTVQRAKEYTDSLQKGECIAVVGTDDA